MSIAKRKWTAPDGKPKSAWVYRYTDGDGKRRLKTFDTKAEAMRFKLQVDMELDLGTHIARSDSITVASAMEIWLSNCDDRVRAKDKMRARTVRNFRSWTNNHVLPELGDNKLCDLKFGTIQNWVDRLAYNSERPRSRATIEQSVACLRMAIKFAHLRGLIKHNPFGEFKLRIPGATEEPVAIPSKEQIKQLLACSDKNSMGGVAPYLKPLLYMAVFSGLRQGEIRALTWDSIDFDKSIIKVRVSADNRGLVDKPKSRAGIRDVPIAPELAIELKKWKLASGPNPANLVFVGGSKRMLEPVCIRQSWLRLQRRAFEGKGATEIISDGYHFHALRHVCASLLIEAGLPAKRIQQIMGHTSIQMTFDRYGHLFEDAEAVRRAVSQMGLGIV